MRYSIEDIQRFVNRFYGGAPLLVTPYGYPIQFTGNISSGGRFTQNVNIQANADFVLTEVAYRVIESTSVSQKAAAIVAISFRESGSKEPFTDTPVIMENYCSNGINARPLDYPRFLAGATNVEAMLENVGPDDYANGIDVMLKGFLVRVFN